MEYRIKELRLKKRMKAKQLAEMAGISQPFLSQLETGLREPSTETLQAVAGALDVHVSDLLVREDTDNSVLLAIDKLQDLLPEDQKIVIALIQSLAAKR